MSSADPFKGRTVPTPDPMRVLHRFTKPGGHWAEIRERIVTQFSALEFFVFVDGSLLESELFHRRPRSRVSGSPRSSHQAIH